MSALALPTKVQHAIDRFKGYAKHYEKAVVKAEAAMGRTKDAIMIGAGGLATGVGVGALGKGADHVVLNVRGHQIPLDIIIPVAGAVGAAAGVFGEYSDDAVLFFGGSLAYTLGTLAKQKTIAAASKSVSGFDVVGQF